jgi:predicted transcriptional regulator
MKQILIELDDETARRLEEAAPGKARMRSRFIRDAIRRSLDAIAEARMADAYRAAPDGEPPHLDPAVWEPASARRTGTKRKRR